MTDGTCWRIFNVLSLLIFACPFHALACDGCSCHATADQGQVEHRHSHVDHAHSNERLGAGNPLNWQSSNAVTASGGPVTFAVVGDTQNGEFGGGVLSELTRDINALNPDFVLFPGDLIGDTGNNGWQAWKDTTAALGNRRLMTPGNHDVGADATYSNWQNTFDWLPQSQTLNGVKGVDAVDYFVDSNGVRFVSISTDRPGDRFSGGNPPASDWLAEVMQDVDQRNGDSDPANDIAHVFTFSHRAVTTQNESATGGTDGDWWQLMTGQTPQASAASTAFLAGHWHMYQPSRPDPRVDTMEIISGTGGGGLEGASFRNQHGFSLITVEGGSVTSRFYGDRNGSAGGWSFTSVIDTITVQQDGGLPTGELALYDSRSTTLPPTPAPHCSQKAMSSTFMVTRRSSKTQNGAACLLYRVTVTLMPRMWATTI